MTTGQRDIYALIDSGAPVSLLSYERYSEIDADHKSSLSPPSVNLRSVTGQPLELVGTATLTFSMADNLQVTHQFHVAKNLQPYEAIIGLDFLAEPEHQIRHELSNFVLCYQQTPIRLFNSDRQAPCATVLPVRANGRHQYVSPRSVTFVKVQIPDDAEGRKLCGASGGFEFEFRPHPVLEGAPQPIPCLIDHDDLETGNMVIGLLNTTDRGRVIKNNDALGYLVPVNTKPFQDLVAAVMLDREQKGQQTPPAGVNVSGPSQNVTRESTFLNAFQYGEMTPEQLTQVQDLLLQCRDCFVMEGMTWVCAIVLCTESRQLRRSP